MPSPRFLASISIALTMACGVLLLVLYGPGREAREDETAERGFSIAGRLITPDGAVPPNTWVRVTSQQDGLVRSVSVVVKPDGAFEAPDLAPGSYRLRASQRAQGEKGAERELGSTTVTIADRDVTGVAIGSR